MAIKYKIPKFFEKYDGQTVSTCNDEYGYVSTPDGVQFAFTGLHDVRDEIQSCAKTSDMAYILQQIANGNASVLQQNTEAVYADMSGKKDLFESLVAAQEAKEAFATLPKEIREKYGNSVYSFARACDSGEFDKYITDLLQDKRQDTAQVVEESGNVAGAKTGQPAADNIGVLAKELASVRSQLDSLQAQQNATVGGRSE